MSRKTKEEGGIPPSSRLVCEVPRRTPGNVKPLDGAAIPVTAQRLAWNVWVERRVATWSSITFVSLNFKSTIWSNAGHVIHLDEQTARKEVKKFGNRVDRAAYGNMVRRYGRRVRRIPFLEYGQDRGWHCHLIMEKPPGMADVRFVKVLKEAWTQSEWSAEPPDIRVAEVSIADYLTKYRSKSEMEAWSDTIVVEAVVPRTK